LAILKLRSGEWSELQSDLEVKFDENWQRYGDYCGTNFDNGRIVCGRLFIRLWRARNSSLAVYYHFEVIAGISCHQPSSYDTGYFRTCSPIFFLNLHFNRSASDY
jgi:hypothetical protein